VSASLLEALPSTVTIRYPKRKGFVAAYDRRIDDLTTTPLPGRPVRGSTGGRPLMAALDLLGRRWALRVLWELRDGPLGFRALQAACDSMSSSVLRDRLGELAEAGLIGRDGDRYALTPLGDDLGRAMRPLAQWAGRWEAQLAADAVPCAP
jgi:DNA-binding HxlR family transcriptional regulator